MFTSLSYLKKHTPQNGTDRESYLSLLVDEFINSPSNDAKCQVLANLANFAYDPINYGFIRDVGVLDIFLYVIKNETNFKLLQFATTGICNLCPDPLNADYLIKHDVLKPLEDLLKSKENNIIADVITILIYLSEESKSFMKEYQISQQIQILKESDDKVVSQLATIFLEQEQTKETFTTIGC
ncbi:armadillo repeat-containing protein 7 [Zerene cesonia]|uniref:armadillo repeat-containing protein 7 n=1 Tax=Zerene cesonia TaxID=33412 RepID=UPI0018E54955|nr:armadillo repeat-containing protein 7 [Zerene cesonia]